jgi:hypothetical protein
MRFTIPPIPPFSSCDDNSDDEGGDDDDFIALLERRLEEDVDFAEELEKSLDQDLLHDASLHNRPIDDASQQLALGDIHNVDDIDSNDQEINGKNRPPKSVRGKCHKPYQFGNLFESCWYVKFLGPDKNGVEGRRTIMFNLSITAC